MPTAWLHGTPPLLALGAQHVIQRVHRRHLRTDVEQEMRQFGWRLRNKQSHLPARRELLPTGERVMDVCKALGNAGRTRRYAAIVMSRSSAIGSSHLSDWRFGDWTEAGVECSLRVRVGAAWMAPPARSAR